MLAEELAAELSKKPLDEILNLAPTSAATETEEIEALDEPGEEGSESPAATSVDSIASNQGDGDGAAMEFISEDDRDKIEP